ncbi:putative holin-like toxin [Leuconostoc suionicum]
MSVESTLTLMLQFGMLIIACITLVVLLINSIKK